MSSTSRFRDLDGIHPGALLQPVPAVHLRVGDDAAVRHRLPGQQLETPVSGDGSAGPGLSAPLVVSVLSTLTLFMYLVC